MIRTLIFLTLSLLSCGTNKDSKKLSIQKLVTILEENQNGNQWIFERIESSKLIFKNGRIIDTKLRDLKYIGQIPLENKDPYLIISGVDCDSCDANSSIYIHSPSDGELIIGSGINTYGEPGKIFSYLNDSLVYEGRAFYGQVLKNRKGVIWYQKELMDTGIWKISVFFTEIINNKKVDQFLTDPKLMEQTLLLWKQGLCEEIKGANQTSEP
jgi:hypothetical protein